MKQKPFSSSFEVKTAWWVDDDLENILSALDPDKKKCLSCGNFYNVKDARERPDYIEMCKLYDHYCVSCVRSIYPSRFEK